MFQKHSSRNSYPRIDFRFLRRKIFLIPFFLLAVAFILQSAYFLIVFASKPSPENPDLVVVYSGVFKSTQHGLELARQFKCPAYFSESIQTVRSLIDPIADKNLNITCDPRAHTTDQNARYTAPFIRRGGYRRVALVTAWFHEPRALFLTRLSLLFTGAKVAPYPNEPTPNWFWMSRDFWVEIFKFWGSLFRVGLHLVGIENWPVHS